MRKTETQNLFIFLKLSVFSLAVFLFLKSPVLAENSLVINEIMLGEDGFANNEFVELYNNGKEEIDLAGYKLTKKASSGTESNLVSTAKFLGKILPDSFFVIAHPSYLSIIGVDLAYSGTSYSLAKDNTVILYDSKGIIVDKVGFGLAKDFEGSAAINPENGKSIGRKEASDSNNNSLDFFQSDSTPKKKNEFEKKEEVKIFSSSLRLNEIFPAPKNSVYEEYIELFNFSSENIDLENWKIKDASKTGEYIFLKGSQILAESFLTIFKKDFKFALNNSGGETVFLFDPSGKLIDSVSYQSAKDDASFGFDGEKWRWSESLTPNAENIFAILPEGEVSFDEEIFENIYANFEVHLADGLKAVWDFGDGHKSYLPKTRHKYEKTGQYNLTLKISGKSEDVLKNFSIEVRKYPKVEVKIIKIIPNPIGSDENESIVIENKSKKKVNLNGWSIATGSKKIINHPISEDVVIKKGKTFEITKSQSKFTLNNTKGKVELRYPDGKVASKAKYDNGKVSIEEGMVYEKVKGGWVWKQNQKSIKSIKLIKQENENVNPESSVISNQGNEKQNGSDFLDDQVVIVDEEKLLEENQKKKIKILLPEKVGIVGNLVEDNLNEKVLGVSTEKNWQVYDLGDKYIFTISQNKKQHYAVAFLKNLLVFFNAKMNNFLSIF